MTTPRRLLPICSLLFACACDGAAPDPAPASDAPPGEARPAVAERPAAITDTIRLEGMPEPMRLGLFRAGDDFPLPFSAYVPEDMAAETSTDGDASSVHFFAEFGGQRNELAFLHVFVFPEGTDLNEAVATARGYRAGRGVPVSQGIEPLGEGDPSRVAWAEQAYRFRYQAGGEWYVGGIAVGEHAGRYFQVVRHYPAEYGDGFAPRADLILETWQWADGEGLEPSPEEPPPEFVEPDPLSEG